MKRLKILRFSGDWGKLCAKIWFCRQSVTTCFAKSKKTSKTGEDQETLISSITFECYCQMLAFRWKTGN